MRYMLMIYEDERIYGENKDNAAMKAMIGRHGEFIQKLGPKRIAGNGLCASTAAKTVAFNGGGGRAVHDGPFAEAREQLGGFYVVDVPDLDAAIAVAREMPLATGGSIEIRPLLDGE